MRDLFKSEVEDKEQRRSELESELKELLIPKDRNDGKNVIVEIRGRGGRRRGEPLGRRALPHVPALRRAAPLEDRAALGPAVGHGWLPRGDVRRQGQGRVVAAQARSRPAPRAAGAGDREPGPGAHERGDRRGPARGRRGRHHDRPERPRGRCVPVDRSGRSVRQHHGLRGADDAQADRDRRHVPGREEPAAEQGQGAAHPAVTAAPDGAATESPRSSPTPAAARPGAVVAPRRSAPTTSRRTGSPITASG